MSRPTSTVLSVVTASARAAVLACLISFLVTPLHATTYSWTGAVDGVWTNAANWDTNGVPVDDNPGSSQLTFPQNGVADRIRLAAYGSTNPLPTSAIPNFGGSWNASEFDTPSIDVLYGTNLNLRLLSLQSAFWSGAGVTFLTVGDGDTENGTVTVNFSGVDQLNRQCSGTQRWIVYADGTLNFTDAGTLIFAYDSTRSGVLQLAGGKGTVNGALTKLATTQGGSRPSYVEFTMPGAQFVAKFGSEFADLSAVQAEIGPANSFRIGTTGLDDDVYIDAVDKLDGSFELTLIDPPPSGTVLLVK